MQAEFSLIVRNVRHSSVYSVASIHGKGAVAPHVGKTDPGLPYWLLVC